MKTVTLVSVSAIALALVAVGAYQLGTRHGAAGPGSASPSVSSSVSSPVSPPGSPTAAGTVAPTTAPAPAATGDARPAAKGERQVLYWHDPMVPAQKFDKPGKSPFMDMPLVPVYADEAGGAGVAVSAGVAQNLGIRTALVRKADLAGSLDLVGVVAQNERATEVVQSRVTGYVERLQVRAVLDPVKKGQPLVTIYAPEWAAALEEYLGVRRAQAGPAIIAAARARLRLLSIPEGVIAQSEQSDVAQTRFTLTAPVSGVVAELGVRDGAMVTPGMTLFRIVDLSSVWVLAGLPESQAAQVRLGDTAEVRVAGLTDAYAGKLSAILPDVDAATRTLKARIELANPGQLLKPGMFVRVNLKQATTQQALVIPQEAVIATGKRSLVIVAGEGGKYRPVEVQLGRESGADVEVKAGLTEGQKIVSSGQFLLDSEASMKSGITRLDTEAPKTAAPAPVRYSAEGRIESIDPDGVRISHGPIPALKWGAMTMMFKVPGQDASKDPGQGATKGPAQSAAKAPAQSAVGDLKVGARVQFEFIQQGDDYVLQSVKPAGSAR